MKRKFGEIAEVHYHDVSREEVRAAHEDMVANIQENHLIYPVTVIDGRTAYDGAVSYPAIMRAIQQGMQPAETA